MQTIVVPGELCKDQDYSKARLVSESFDNFRPEPQLDSELAAAFTY